MEDRWSSLESWGFSVKKKEHLSACDESDTTNNVPVFYIKPGRVCHEHNPGHEREWTPVAHMTVTLLIST